MDGCAGLHDTSRSPAPSQQEQLENLANLQHLAQQGGVPDVPASSPMPFTFAERSSIHHVNA